jgi:putative MATE family efflux protein
VLTFALMTTNTILDRAFVGQLGRDALAGVGVGGQVLFMLVSLSMAITTGTTALVARFTGARTPEEVNHAAGQSLSLSLCIGVVCTLALFFALEPLLHLLGLEAAARAQVRAFLYYALLGMVPMFLANVLGSVYRGMGDTRTPLKVMLFANIVHILGDWTLMLGHWGFPRLGLAGGGIAVTASNVVALLVYLRMVRRSGFRDSVRFAHLRLTLEWIWRILRIGIPAAITALLRVTSMMGFTGLLARTAEGTSAVAALPIGMTAESIAFMPGLGFSIAASALVGQALGARDPSRAERYGWAAAWQAVAIMSFMGLVFFLGAEPFARVFTRDPVVLRLAVSYLQIMAISEPMLAFGMVFTGALQGAGDTMRPTVLTAITFWGVRIPAAWLLALQLGLQAKGAWIAMSFTTIVGGFFTVLLFRDGKWKRVRV